MSTDRLNSLSTISIRRQTLYTYLTFKNCLELFSNNSDKRKLYEKLPALRRLLWQILQRFVIHFVNSTWLCSCYSCVSRFEHILQYNDTWFLSQWKLQAQVLPYSIYALWRNIKHTSLLGCQAILQQPRNLNYVNLSRCLRDSRMARVLSVGANWTKITNLWVVIQTACNSLIYIQRNYNRSFMHFKTRRCCTWKLQIHNNKRGCAFAMFWRLIFSFSGAKWIINSNIFTVKWWCWTCLCIVHFNCATFAAVVLV